jgi:hypothetical protein
MTGILHEPARGGRKKIHFSLIKEIGSCSKCNKLHTLCKTNANGGYGYFAPLHSYWLSAVRFVVRRVTTPIFAV